MNIANISEWWKVNETILPHWAEAGTTVQPSSAASERVLSLLNNTFGKRRNSSPEDYVESCIMLQYNKHFYVGIFGHKIGHNRAKIMAMPKSING